MSNIRFEHILVYVCIILSCFAYLPNVLFTPLYSAFTSISMLCIFLSLILHIKRKAIILNYYLKTAIPILIIVSITYFIYEELIFKHFVNLYLTLTIYLFGYTLNDHSQKFIRTIIKVYCITALLMGLYSILTGIGGFQITEGGYAILLKNSSGVILGCATIMAYHLSTEEESKKNKIIWIVIAIVLFLSLLTFRNRSTSVGVIILFLIILFKHIKKNGIKSRDVILAIAILGGLSIVGINPINYIIQSFTENTDTTDLESFSSGRTYMYSKAIEIYSNDVIGGNLSQNIKLLTVDNFVLSLSARTGIWGMIIYMPIYFYLWVISIKNIITNKNTNSTLPYYCIFILLVVSFFEASYPFGPGTAIFISYFLLGHTNSYKYKKEMPPQKC